MQSNLQLKALMEIKRVTSEAVVISTPNRYYLKDNHDTGLKFVHWMPRYFGIKYSMKFWKGEPFHQSLHCRFLSHYEVEKILSDFKLVTPLLCFSDINEYLQIFPVYCPYGGGWLTGISKAKLNLLKLIFPILGEKSRYFLPSIQGIYIRQKNIENVY